MIFMVVRVSCQAASPLNRPPHGGVVTLSKFDKRFESGRYPVGPTTLYVHRGVGLEGGSAPRVRFCARPEIAVIDLVPR
jgi:predicted MPP superfamily phosphohydrolase